MALPDQSSPSVLLQLLSSRLIPWAQDDARQRFIVARSVMKASQMPAGVTLESRKPSGHRHIVRGKRSYGNTRMVRAEWPDDGLTELEVPKLLCVVDGCADLLISEYQLTCPAGTFVLVPPGVPHPSGPRSHLEGARRENGFCDLLQIIAVHHGIQCWICRSEGASHAHVPATNYFIRSDPVFSLLNLMAAEVTAGRDDCESICHHLLTTLLLLLRCEIKDGHYLRTGHNWMPETHTAPSSDPLAELNAYLREHLSEPLTLESVARQMHLSRTQFVRRIRQQTGKTFVEHLTECRLQEARVLLAESEWPASVIANIVGFRSSTYFHQFFRRKQGMTPLEYRRKVRDPNQLPQKEHLKNRRSDKRVKKPRSI
jgi:AraC-like DNA-binding protein